MKNTQKVTEVRVAISHTLRNTSGEKSKITPARSLRDANWGEEKGRDSNSLKECSKAA
jgi:hypothetical protein